MAAAVTVFFAMRDAAVDVDTVGELARVLGPYQGFRLGADGSVSVYPASPRVLLPGRSSSWRTAKPQPSGALDSARPVNLFTSPRPSSASQPGSPGWITTG